jgi:glycosyltransferase involved in cell wall biosynthesis
MKKGILFVSYHFPPDSEVGGRRISRIASILHERGWDVGVLTVQERYYPQRDASFSPGGFPTYRTGMIESIRFLFGNVRKGAVQLLKKAGPSDGDAFASAPAGHATESARTAPARRNPSEAMKRFILSLVWCPDDRQGWIPFAVPTCLALARRYPLIYSSSPPYSASLVPLLACALMRKSRWIAEFRDPWTGCYKPEFIVSSISRWIERRLETAVVKRCSRIVVVNEAMKKDFATRYPACENKIWVYSNGYDAEHLRALADGRSEADRRPSVFLHTGSLYQGRDPSTFLAAVSSLIQERTVDPDALKIVFMGDSNAGGRPIRDIAAELGIEKIVRVEGYVPYDQCLAAMRSADVLLLFNINQPLQVPAKFYEYIGLRRKVLSLSTGGITDELVAKTKVGVSVPPNDLEGIKHAICSLMAAPLPAGDPVEIERFEISAIFTCLASELEAFAEREDV